MFQRHTVYRQNSPAAQLRPDRAQALYWSQPTHERDSDAIPRYMKLHMLGRTYSKTPSCQRHAELRKY